MKFNKYFGIDPGLTGALSVFSQHGELIDTYEFTKDGSSSLFSYGSYLSFLEKHFCENILLTVEKQQPYRNMAIQSIFTLGGVYYLQLLPFLEREKQFVKPKEWQKFFNLSDKKTKNESVEKAVELFGNQSRFFGKRGGKKHGVTDACLIGYYGYLSANESTQD